MQPAYNKPSYWDERYKNEIEPLDWLQNYNSLRVHFHCSVLPEDTILNVGCGNSPLSMEMQKDGYRNITNIDISRCA